MFLRSRIHGGRLVPTGIAHTRFLPGIPEVLGSYDSCGSVIQNSFIVVSVSQKKCRTTP